MKVSYGVLVILEGFGILGLPSLKLTAFSHLKMDRTGIGSFPFGPWIVFRGELLVIVEIRSFPFGPRPIFRGELLYSFRGGYLYIYIYYALFMFSIYCKMICFFPTFPWQNSRLLFGYRKRWFAVFSDTIKDGTAFQKQQFEQQRWPHCYLVSIQL